MRSQHLFIFTAISSALFASGCVSPSPRVDNKLGDAMNIAKAQQTINPDASAKRDVTLIDGQSGKAVFEAYEKSYKAPEKPVSVFTIGVGK